MNTGKAGFENITGSSTARVAATTLRGEYKYSN